MKSATYSYLNGNYVVINNYGKLIKRALRVNEELVSDFPDSIDLKISNRCSYGCPFCHESSVKNGKIYDFVETVKVLSQLPKAPIEIAIGGGNIFESLDETEKLLQYLKSNGYEIRITINWKDVLDLTHIIGKWDFEHHKDHEYIIKSDKFDIETATKYSDILNLVSCVGVSLDKLPEDFYTYKLSNNKTPFPYSYFDEKYKNNTLMHYRDVVYHIIAGIFPPEQLIDLIEDVDKPILILGYKQWGRAANTELPESIKEFESVLKQFIYKKRTDSSSIKRDFRLSFDNLALEQLHIKDSLLPEEYEQIYMGDEGTHSMYIDAVNGQFARTSRSENRVDWNSIGLLDFFKLLQNDKSNY